MCIKKTSMSSTLKVKGSSHFYSGPDKGKYPHEDSPEIDMLVEKFNMLFKGEDKDRSSKPIREEKISSRKKMSFKQDKAADHNDISSICKTGDDNKRKREKREDFYISGEDILKTITSQSLGTKEIDGLKGEEALSSPLDSKQIALFISSVAKRVLVSADKSSGSCEVRISLRHNILSNTEVRIIRDGNHLTIEFMTSSHKAKDLLTSQKDALVSYLKDRLTGRNLRIEVLVNYSSLNEGFSNPDGRSRERRNLYQEMEKDVE